VISITPDRPRKQWQFDAAGGIAGPIVRDGMSLFFASKDTNVYRVDMIGLPLRRQLIWKYQTAGVLEKEPQVTQQVVYQNVPGKDLTAIDKQSGQFMWSVSGGVDLLAEAEDKAYVITKNRNLVVMDNLSEKRLYSVNFAEVTRYTANITDSKIYIADERGRIACLQPVK
jgi:outer membrane protein assembly factor BamB